MFKNELSSNPCVAKQNAPASTHLDKVFLTFFRQKTAFGYFFFWSFLPKSTFNTFCFFLTIL